MLRGCLEYECTVTGYREEQKHDGVCVKGMMLLGEERGRHTSNVILFFFLYIILIFFFYSRLHIFFCNRRMLPDTAALVAASMTSVTLVFSIALHS
jgi:hypothetical protein